MWVQYAQTHPLSISLVTAIVGALERVWKSSEVVDRANSKIFLYRAADKNSDEPFERCFALFAPCVALNVLP
jgi:hypothetical protein